MTVPASSGFLTSTSAPASASAPWYAELWVLWRARWLLAAVALVGGVLGHAAATTLIAPSFSASASLALSSRDAGITGLPAPISTLGREERVVNTEAEILRSRALLGRVVDALSLAERPEYGGDPADLAPAQRRARAIAQLADSVHIANPPKTLVFHITARSGDAGTAQAVANALAEAYIAAQTLDHNLATEQATRWLSDRVAELKQDAEAKEAEAEAIAAEGQRVSKTKLDALQRQIAAVRERLASAVLSPADRHALLAEQARLEAAAEGQSVDLVKKRQLSREAEASRLIYQHFLTRLKETAVQQGMHVPESRLISRAALPVAPAWPHVPLLSTIAAILAAGVAAAGLLLREALSRGFRTAEDLEAFTGLPVIGLLPSTGKRAPVAGAPASSRARTPRDLAHIRYLEAIRQVRTVLLRGTPARGARVIAITSATAAEGKSTAAAVLADNLASLGRRTLLVEADLRRPAAADRARAAQRQGLLPVLSKLTPLSQNVRRMPGSLLDVLPASPSPVNPADVFASARFAELIGEMRQSYDFIVLDTPPAGPVPDAAILSQLADRVLFLVAWNRTDGASVQTALRNLGPKSDGRLHLALSFVDPRGAKGYARIYGHAGPVAARA